MPTIRNLWEGLDFHIAVALNPLLRSCISIVVHYIPTSTKLKLLESAFGNHMPIDIVSDLSNKIHFHLVENIFYMARTEALYVREIDDDILEVIESHSHDLAFLYSKIDKYTPAGFAEEMESLCKNGTIKYTTNEEVEHAFVIKHSMDVAQEVFDLLPSSDNK
eukprot:TRINITY_DN2583_c1_g1_i1.p1 TRINITY_DN2583_c1_g1~~TRINITY_DN2583_c1_g1_i1.p1  ORF type:complete len:163 (+),score=37.17 TRINITY_DN2583_c1_g1_i1:467-955(+)